MRVCMRCVDVYVCACDVCCLQGPGMTDLPRYLQEIHRGVDPHTGRSNLLVLYRGLFVNLLHRVCCGGIVMTLLLQYPEAAFAFENVVN